ncbi:CPBP family intramembrane glutamic endopeptidase [Tenacibaculum agarivorans]|uniref:CPBP family intramembrane glutamic endopeptidase n=1 Tax=Tenacibaculum agarivorans TaxID=1908389 RepID=UPI00094B8DA5|nr:type II CAAX endopeptidase family protein [Tenacibaculum agarivorans]
MNEKLKKIVNYPITRIVLGIGICLLVLIGFQNFISKPIFQSLIVSKEISDLIINYVSVAVLLTTYYYLFQFYEKRKITELSRKYLFSELGGGFLLGFFILSIVILILHLLGYYKILSFSGFTYFLGSFSFLVIAALIEEIFFRAILYRILENWIGTYIALAIISVVFELPHIFNDNVTVLSVVLGLLFGFAHGIMYTYSKRIWLPFAFHLGWNFAQPFYGSNLSGIDSVGSVFKAEFTGPKLITGTINYGIEDSILSIFLLLIVCIVFFYLSVKESKIIPYKK